MSQVVKSTAVFLISSPTVQSLIDCGLYRVCGPESITASSIRAAEWLANVIEEKKPSGLAARLANEFFAVGAGRILLGASDSDFERMAAQALDRATEIEKQLNSHDFDAEPQAAVEQSASEHDSVPANEQALNSSKVPASEPTSVVEPTPAAGQTDVASPASEPAAELKVDASAVQAEVAIKPEDAPVEVLAEHGIPSKLIEALVAAGLTTAKQVRDRDEVTPIDDLTDIGPAIRKKILAAIDEAIA